LPNLTQPDVYFGLNDPGYVVANSKQAELNYQAADGTNVETHYSGPAVSPWAASFAGSRSRCGSGTSTS